MSFYRIIADLLSSRLSGAEEEKNILDRCAAGQMQVVALDGIY
jgi:hypothetical protein